MPTMQSGHVLHVLLGAALAFSGGPRRDDGDAAAQQTVGDPRQIVRAHRIATRALTWLSGRVRSNGSLDMSPADPRSRARLQPTLAASALTALAFMANGHTADDSEDGHGARVRATIGWLTSQAAFVDCSCDKVKGPHEMARFADGVFTTSHMHTQGYVTWALAMACGMSFGEQSVDQRAELMRVTQAAIHAIEFAQEARGGWWYGFEAEASQHEGSVTVTVLQALRSAKEAGLRVDPTVIARAVDYLRQSQVDKPDDSRYGAFRYKHGDPMTSFALTAAAVSSLNQTGDYDSRFVDLGIEFMRQKDPLTHASIEPERWPWYGRFYATQAYWQYRELRHFRGWYPALVDVAENEQDDDDGHFDDDEFGEVYATAMAALTLGVPFGYLPSFER
jgi:hypothetical protein